jgi:two-component system, NtrC family, nitrogen regulation response regulator NtrX
MPTVLIVDDEPNILLTLSQALQLEDYATEIASNAKVAFEILEHRPVDAMLLDVRMPDLDGLAALARIQKLKPELPVIMMSGHGSIETAVKATQLGARDFLEKPISRDRLLLALRNALLIQRVTAELESLQKEHGPYEMLGDSPAMLQILELIQRVAPTQGRVLISGENGTGKELIAHAIHRNSPRNHEPFVKVNCAAVPHDLIESELFGHERGAFTGATNVRRGKFELAHRGTLFLDEVGDMPQAMQAKLLRVLQESKLERVGGSETLQVDVRVLAATNKNLELEIAKGNFREDLFFRLNVVQIHAPSLRERKHDLPLLIHRFLIETCQRNGRKGLQLSPGALQQLMDHDFPGNVRELKNLVERLAILCTGPVVSREEAEKFLPPRRTIVSEPLRSIETSQMPVVETAPSHRYRADKTFREQSDEAEREIILGALLFAQDNATEAARLLDLERGHFYKKMKALGLKRSGGETQLE